MTGYVCPNCGGMNRTNAKICAKCGKPLAAPMPPAPPPPSSPPPPQPMKPRQMPPAPPQAQTPPAVPPPRAPAAPYPQPAPIIPRQPPPAQPAPPRRFPFALKRWQYVALGGLAILLCLCIVLAVSINRFFGATPLVPISIGAKPPTASPQASLALPSATATVLPSPTATPSPELTPRAQPIAPTATTGAPRPSTPPLSPVRPTGPIVAPPATPEPPPPTVVMSGTALSENKMTMSLQGVKFTGLPQATFLVFDLSLQNDDATEIAFNWMGEDIKIRDDLNNPYPQVFYQKIPPAPDSPQHQEMRGAILQGLAAGEKYAMNIQVRGILNDKATKVFVNIAKAGRLRNIRWEIPVPR